MPGNRRLLVRGFTLVELLIVIAIIALLIGILLPGLGQARKTARKVICASNLQQYGIAHISYMADFKDMVAAYNWRGGVRYMEADPDIQYAGGDSEAAMNQAVHILRTQADRSDIRRLTGRIPHRRYSHLILNAYLQQRLPEPTMACPEDKFLINWQRDPHHLDPLPGSSGGTPASGEWLKFWGYSSTYQLVPAAWSADQSDSRGSTVTQYPGDHNLMWMGSKRMGGRGAWEIAFPGSKVGVFSFHDRHSSKMGLYHAYKQAVAPAMFWDGSVRFERTSDGNEGFNPGSPASPAPTTYQYTPHFYKVEPPTVSGRLSDTVRGHYRWTRGGLKGIDFGSGEIDTGQIR